MVCCKKIALASCIPYPIVSASFSFSNTTNTTTFTTPNINNTTFTTPNINTSTNLTTTFSLPSLPPSAGPAISSIPTFQPPRSSKKFCIAASNICHSLPLHLTLENWRNSNATKFLQNYALQHAGEPGFVERGLIGSIAYQYLGRTDFHCTLGSSHACMVSCNEVVSLVPDPMEARAVYFILTAARHYLEVIEVADHAMLAAQVNVGQWTDSMALKFFWVQETHHDRVFKMSIDLLSSFISFMVFTFAPLVPFHAAEKSIEAKIKELNSPAGKVPVMGLDADKAALEIVLQKENLEKKLKMTKASQTWANVAYNAFGNGVPILGAPALEFWSWEGYERAQMYNVAELGLAVSHLISDARAKNAQGIKEAFSGRIFDDQGTTMLSQVLESGAFLSVTGQMLHQWSGPQVERRLTDALKFRIMSEAMKCQGVYIHCTKDMNAFTCEGDDRGPQNLKACIDDRVCYMNKWSGRGFWWRHHVEEPFGADQMGDWPFLVDPENIIISSYKTYKLLKGTSGNKMDKFITKDDLITPQNFMDAATPGAFFLPVCVNDRFHQNTPLDDHNLWDNFSQSSEKKTLPCSCGEFWSDETEGIWRDTGLATAKHATKYRTKFCAKQLSKKIPDNKLERFVAECRLGVSNRGGFFDSYVNERHTHCDVVIDLLTKLGKGPDDVNPYLRLALECKAGLHVTSVRHKPRKECDLYLTTGYEDLAKEYIAST